MTKSFMEDLGGALKNGLNYQMSLEESGKMRRIASRGEGKSKNTKWKNPRRVEE